MWQNGLKKIWYGGDYNPEQWGRSIWDEDARLFKLAGIDVATVNVFTWALLQPSEEEYDFSMLDHLLEKLGSNGVSVCLGTATAAHPAWMAKRYPGVLRVDWEGRKRQFGGRHNSCPNSPVYRKYAARLADKLAERYRDHPGLVMWHVSNEYGGYCYCEQCAAAFREWLRNRYGTLGVLNLAWYTSFWGHTFYDWDEIVPPNMLSEGVHWNYKRSNQNSISLDYFRFQSDSLLACYQLEAEAIRKHSAVPITTNFMGAYKELDYMKWAKAIDVISWDSYPAPNQPPARNAWMHDLMRGLKEGQPFMLMEQTPSHANWQPYCKLKRNGEIKKWSYQAIARGADTVMFFQLRKSAGSCEKMHGAVIEHAGHEHTRVFRECAELGQELQRLGDKLIGARVEAKVAILFDWDNWWALELSSGPSNDMDYVNEVFKFYEVLFEANIQTDTIGLDADFSSYEILIAPVMYMVKPGFAAKAEAFVKAGGTFVTTYFSGIAGESDVVPLGGYPGELRSLLGIWAEETDALYPDESNRIVMKAMEGEFPSASYSCSFLCDLIHAESAEVVAEYGDDFYAGMPAVTVNRFGAGQAWYIATSPEKAFLQQLLSKLCKDKGIKPLLPRSAGIEVSRRVKGDSSFTFVINHLPKEATLDVGTLEGLELLRNAPVQGALTLPPYGVAIVETEQRA